MTSKKRVAIIGAGHNALVCACYLAKAGHDVTVYERRSRVGGAVNTEEMWWEPCELHRETGGNFSPSSPSSPPSGCASCLSQKYQVDTCSVMHILIHKTPIIEELGLHRFGLEYMQMDPWGFAPFSDGSHILFYKDLDRTCQSIAAISERDAERYSAFVRKWRKFNEQVFEVFARSPTPGSMLGGIARRTAIAQARGERDPSMTGAELLRQLLGSYDKMLGETFESSHVRAAVGWMAAQSGPPPSEVGAGALAGAHSLYHEVGATRPRGGSGMLSQALARCLEHYGGTARCNAPVKRVLLGSGGRARGLELAGGERVDADLVVSGAHAQTTLLGLVGREHLPGPLVGKLESLRVGSGIGMTLRCPIDALPAYAAYTPSHQGHVDCHHAMQLICPSLEYLQRAYDDARRGYPARQPALVAMTPSSVDPGIAPHGKHSLYIWAQYHPYDLAGGESWDGIREREANRLLRTLAEHAPNIPTDVRELAHHYIQTPLDLERNVGLLRGNIMHIDMSLDQMFMFRPLPELAYYKTPIEGLYLTGASTHPGGGVSGASGRNAAHAVLTDLAAKRRSWRGVALAGAGLVAAGLVAGRRNGRKRGMV